MFKQDNRDLEIEKMEKAVNETAIKYPYKFYKTILDDYIDYRKTKIKYNDLKKKYKTLREKHVATMNQPSGLFEFGRDDVSDTDDRLVRPRLRIRIPTPRVSFEDDQSDSNDSNNSNNSNYITPPAAPRPSSPPQLQR